MAKIKDLLIFSSQSGPSQTGQWTYFGQFTDLGALAVWDPTNSRAYFGGEPKITTDQFVTVSTPAVNFTDGGFASMVGSYILTPSVSHTRYYFSNSGTVYTQTNFTSPNVPLSHSVGGTTTGLLYDGTDIGARVLRVDPVANTRTDISGIITTARSASMAGGHGAYISQQGYTVLGGTDARYLISSDNQTFTEYTMNPAQALPTGPITAVTEASNGRCIFFAAGRVWRASDVTIPATWNFATQLVGVTINTTLGSGNIIASASDDNIILISGNNLGARDVAVSTDNGLNWNITFNAFYLDADEKLVQMSYAGNRYFFVITNKGRVYYNRY